MGVVTGGADARVEVYLVAAEPHRLGVRPLEQPRGPAPAPSRRPRREVVDVEDTSPRQVLEDPEAGDGVGTRCGVVERGDEAVAPWIARA